MARVTPIILYNSVMHYDRIFRQSVLVVLFIGFFSWAAPNFIGSQASATLAEVPATAKVEKGNLTIPIERMGQVISPSDVFLNAVNGSQITAIYVIPGQHVKAGQVLAQLDSNQQKQTLLADQAILNSQVTDVTHALSVITDIVQTNQIDEQRNEGTVQAARVALQNAQVLAAANASLYHLPVTQNQDNLQTAQKKFSAYTKIYTNVLDGTPPYCTQTGAPIQSTTNSSGSATNSQNRLDSGTATTTNSTTTTSTTTTAIQAAACDAYYRDYATFRDAELAVSTAQSTLTAAQKTEAINLLKDTQEINRLQAALDQAILLQSANRNKNAQSLETAKRALMTLEARFGVFINQSNPSPIDFSVIQGTLALDQIDLNAQTITSPVDGDIGAINGIVGQPAPTKGPNNFFTITNVSKPQLEVVFPLNQRADLVTLGQRVSVNFASLNGGTDLGGKVILNIKSPGLFDTPPGRRLRIAFDDYNQGLYPDLAGKVSLTITAVKQALLIPNGAIQSVSGSDYVYLIEKNTKGVYTKSQQKVIVGVKGLNTTEIRSGLEEGQLVEVAHG